MMKVCVFGAGAIGGYLAARLIHAGGEHQVSVVARGAQLRGIVDGGLRLLAQDEDFIVRPHAVTDSPCQLAPQDLVFVALKSHAQPAAARDIAALLGPDGAAVFVNNGIPWWWTYHGEAAPDARPLPLLDPQAALWNSVGPARAMGCVVYSANEIVQPGVVRHVANNQWLLGEPDRTRSPRLLAAVELMRHAGLQATAAADIRHCVWVKLLRNAPLNTICALTRLPADGLCGTPGLVDLCAAVIDEVVAIAAADGSDVSGQAENAKAALGLGAAVDGSRATIRPSMLQDVLQNRRMEVDAILGQVQAFARASATPCPTIDTLLPLLRGLGQGIA
ncbi:2-dehydropantoate 2-reductase [compost metagenome]